MGFYIKKAREKIKPVLNEKEEIMLIFKQSLLSDIAPAFIVATNQRLVIINNSFWGLYTDINLLAPTDYDYIPYSKIMSVVLVRGKLLSSVDIRLLGGFETNISPQKKTEGEIDGLRLYSAISLMKFIEEQIRRLEEPKAAKEDRPQIYKGGHMTK
jgi:hypothetical protein